jgi:hypothetical protein
LRRELQEFGIVAEYAAKILAVFLGVALHQGGGLDDLNQIGIDFCRIELFPRYVSERPV